MSLSDKQKSFIENLCRLSENTLSSLIQKFTELLSEGEIYIENRSVGFAFHVSVAADKVKFDDIKVENVGDMFYAISGLAESFLHSEEINTDLLEKMGLQANLLNKIKFIQTKLSESDVLSEINYQLHTAGPRMISGGISWNTKRLEFTKNSHPAADIVLMLNHNRETKHIAFEVDKISLSSLIKELNEIGKDLDNISKTKNQVKEKNE